MDFSGIIGLLISLVIAGLTIVGVIRLAMSYANGDSKDSKREIKHFIIVCFFLGLLPGLPAIALTAGKAVVKPVSAIINTVSNQVEKEATKTAQGN